MKKLAIIGADFLASEEKTDEVPMVYPYMTEDPRLRTRLISVKIYISLYWSGVRKKLQFTPRTDFAVAD